MTWRDNGMKAVIRHRLQTVDEFQREIGAATWEASRLGTTRSTVTPSASKDAAQPSGGAHTAAISIRQNASTRMLQIETFLLLILGCATASRIGFRCGAGVVEEGWQGRRVEVTADDAGIAHCAIYSVVLLLSVAIHLYPILILLSMEHQAWSQWGSQL